MLGSCGVVVAQWSERRQLRSEALGSIPSGYPCMSILIYHQSLPPVVVKGGLTYYVTRSTSVTRDSLLHYRSSYANVVCCIAMPLGSTVRTAK